MTTIRLGGYNLGLEYIGDQCELTCQAPPGWPPCPWRLRFPLAWWR
jgi:hypothetical protein